MLRRVSLFASILSLTASGAFLSSASADWYGIEIRSKEQAAMEAAERQKEQFNLPREAWYESATNSGQEKAGPAGKCKASASSVTEVEQTTSVWSAAKTPLPVDDSVAESNVTSEQVDSAIAEDVDTLLNQEEKWFAPMPGAEEASQDLQKVNFEASGDIAESMTYLDELRELGERETDWIQSSVVTQQKVTPDFDSSASLIETQPIYLTELEQMADRQSYGMQLPSMKMVSERNQSIIDATNDLIAQTDAGYSPKVEGDKGDAGDQMESLFPSLSKISVAGGSTRTNRPKDVQTPKNLAAVHMESLIPGEYVMGPVVGVSAPSRYPLCFQHNPLYFEDPNLERCGVSQGYCTTAYSAAKFVGQTIGLPYLVIATPPKTCMASLGDCPTCAEFDCDAYFREWTWNR